MKSKTKLFPIIIGIAIIVLISSYYYSSDNLNTSENKDYIKIIDNIFSNESKNIRGAVVFYGKGDIPLINHLYSNYPLESIYWISASKDDNPEKYNLIMELIKEIPLQIKGETGDLNINDYYIIGANIDWDEKRLIGVNQHCSYIRLFVDKNYNIYLPEIYPYHDNNATEIVGNKFMALKANDKARELIENIIKDIT
ncbi:MAG: hypothetical protein AB7E31_15945 [Desulfitobacterium sp.]